jgi:hypothetical protein
MKFLSRLELEGRNLNHVLSPLLVGCLYIPPNCVKFENALLTHVRQSDVIFSTVHTFNHVCSLTLKMILVPHYAILKQTAKEYNGIPQLQLSPLNPPSLLEL